MDLPTTADAVIIGGGINGASIAYHLALAGIRRIVVLDAARAGRGASSRGAGIIRTYHADDSEARLAIATLATYRNWHDEIGGTAGYRPTGFMWMVGPDGVDSLSRIAKRQSELGAQCEVLSADEMVRLQPHLSPDGIGAAAYEPDGGCGNPAQATASLHQAAARLGVLLLEGMSVSAISVSGGRVIGVSTAASDIVSPLVVLAAGAWSVPLAASAGVVLPLVPTRMTTGIVRHAPLGGSPSTFIDTVTDTFFRSSNEPGIAHISIRDERHNTVLDAAKDWEDEPVAPSASLEGIARLRVRMPSLAATPLDAWVGPDGVTSDKRGIYGKVHGLQGLVLCVGGNYKGFKVAPAVGRLIAELVVTDQVPIELQSFALDRFSSLRPMGGPGRYSLADVA
jgi:sarcosine oxidase, subunit beta